MLKQLLSEIISDINDSVPGLGVCDFYRYEFEKGADWNPKFPACLVEYNGVKPINEVNKLADGSFTKAYVYLTLYAADKNKGIEESTKKEFTVLDLVESLQSLFIKSTVSITIDGKQYKFNVSLNNTGTDLFGYNNGVVVYTVSVKIEIPYVLIQNIAEPPEKIILSLPSNGANDILADNADLEFAPDPAAIDYEIFLSESADFSELTFSQARWNYNKLTIPNGMLSAGVEYFWKVRARGAGGIGEWSDTRSFTVGVSEAITPLNPSQISNNILWLRTDSGLTVVTGNKVSQWDDLSGQGNHFTQSSDANRPVLTANAHGTHSGLYHDPAAGVRKTLGYNDTVKKFEILSGMSKSLMVTFKPDNAYSYANNAIVIIARSNSNYGDNYVLGKYNDNLYNIRGVMQFPVFSNNQVVSVPVTGDLIQVVITYNGVTMKLYRNGSLLSNYDRALTTAILNEAGSYLTIGSEYHTANNSISFKGYTFEAAFWTKELSAGEVASLYEYHNEFYN